MAVQERAGIICQTDTQEPNGATEAPMTPFVQAIRDQILDRRIAGIVTGLQSAQPEQPAPEGPQQS